MSAQSGWGQAAQPPTSEPPSTCDAVVVGLGATGLTCLLRLASAGLDVVGIDQRGVASGAAGRNGGFLLAGIASFHHDAVERYGRPAARAWYTQTLAALDETFEDAELGAVRVGSLRAAVDDAEADDCARHLAALQLDGFPGEWHDGPDGRGVLLPCDGAFDPVRRSSVLAARVLRAGGRLVTGTPVVAVGDGAVTTEAGQVRARHVIIAVDGGLEWLVPEVGDDARTVRLQMLSTAPVDQAVCSRPVYRRDGLDYYQQVSDGRLYIGGGRDVGGPGEWLATGEAAEPTDVVQRYLDDLLGGLVDRPVEVEHRWGAAVAMSASGLPVVRTLGEGTWVLGAYNGTGNVVGPVIATALCERLLTGRSPALDPWLRP